MKHITLFSLALLLSFGVMAQRRQVVSIHENGNPEFVVWTKGKNEKSRVVKEEAYYPDGTVEYTGTYRREKEHGTWIFYYETGIRKMKKNYRDGVLQGVTKEFAPDGSLRNEIHYRDGRVEREIRHK
ncbi:MAG: hypothetical protein EA392_11030 [Cryomorphaceae bacterium]|nr:MAG: hypothetical protein EA392_11030 [Cryomorphaceae bacterium]